MNEFQIDLLKNPLNVDSFLRYALSLSALGHSEKAVRAAKIAIDSYSPAKSISPLMLRKYFIPEDFVRSDSLVEVKGKNFVPSFVVDDNDHPLCQTHNMLFVHIPKCAGTYFFSPLNILAKNYSDYLCGKFLDERDLISIFTGTRFDNEQILKGYVSSFSSRADDSKNAIHMVSDTLSSGQFTHYFGILA